MSTLFYYLIAIPLIVIALVFAKIYNFFKYQLPEKIYSLEKGFEKRKYLSN